MTNWRLMDVAGSGCVGIVAGAPHTPAIGDCIALPVGIVGDFDEWEVLGVTIQANPTETVTPEGHRVFAFVGPIVVVRQRANHTPRFTVRDGGLPGAGHIASVNETRPRGEETPEAAHQESSDQSAAPQPQ